MTVIEALPGVPVDLPGSLLRDDTYGCFRVIFAAAGKSNKTKKTRIYSVQLHRHLIPSSKLGLRLANHAVTLRLAPCLTTNTFLSESSDNLCGFSAKP
jgi:hypothetical protein